ncbi:LOW QUALITY PROTEIN: cilia- and flagella-associated protein 184 [Phoenicopterus ruber ruber]
MEPTGPEEPSEPEVAAGPSEPSDPGPSAAAPAADGAGEKEASGRDGAAGEAPPATRAEEAPGPPAPAAPGGAELEQHRGLAAEREQLPQGQRRPRAELGAGGPPLCGQRLLRLREQAAAACRERQARAEAEWAAFQARMKATAVFSQGRRLGGRAADRIQARERDKEQVREAHVENFKLKHEIQNLETILKAQGEQVEGQHLTDFEHMKKENQKHREKMDNRSAEIPKLIKVSNAIHILTQFREKLQFVEAENEGRKAEHMDTETVLSQRDILTKTKQARDRLRRNNLKFQEKCGLLGNEILLWDFEEKVDTVELLSQQLETLKCHLAGLVLTCRGIRGGIKEANSSFLAEDD